MFLSYGHYGPSWYAGFSLILFRGSVGNGPGFAEKNPSGGQFTDCFRTVVGSGSRTQETVRESKKHSKKWRKKSDKRNKKIFAFFIDILHAKTNPRFDLVSILNEEINFGLVLRMFDHVAVSSVQATYIPSFTFLHELVEWIFRVWTDQIIPIKGVFAEIVDA